MKSLAEQIAGHCKHFNGVQHATCKLGINYRQLGDDSRPGYINRLPCLRPHFKEDAVAPCALLEWPTPEEVEAEEKETMAELAKLLGEMADGICPHCHKPIEVYRQVGALNGYP